MEQSDFLTAEEIFEIESEDGVDQLSAEAISNRKDCNVDFEIYEDFQHIKSTAPILGSIGEFCGAFYHVPGHTQSCLDEDNCKVAADGTSSTPPKSVVALVKYEMHDGSQDIIVRYSNHYIWNATKHAEEFFSDDINQPRNEVLRNSISNENLRKITMYITFQPCHLSASHTPEKSCCNVLLQLLNDHERLFEGDQGVQICIKPSHIYKAGNSNEHLAMVERGKQGISLLMGRGIEITRMEEADWNYLLNFVATNQRTRIPPYSGSRRESLDKETGAFLRDIEIELANSICGPTHHCLVKQDDVLHLFHNLSELCAFFHVFEQGAGNESLCLNNPQCPYHINGQEKPNVIVVKGEYQYGGAPYEAKYTDCDIFAIKAEEFLHYGAMRARNVLEPSYNERERGVMTGITVYTTWLPRGFYKMVWCLTRRTIVSVCIKPSHLLGGETSPEDVQEVINLRKNPYITVQSMTQDNWTYLTDNLPEANRNGVPVYESSRRQHLDEEIELILNPTDSNGSSGSYSNSSDSNSGSSDSNSGSSNSSNGGSDSNSGSSNRQGPSGGGDRGSCSSDRQGPSGGGDRGSGSGNRQGPSGGGDRGSGSGNRQRPSGGGDRGSGSGNRQRPSGGGDRGSGSGSRQGPSGGGDRGSGSGNRQRPSGGGDRGSGSSNRQGPSGGGDRGSGSSNRQGPSGGGTSRRRVEKESSGETFEAESRKKKTKNEREEKKALKREETTTTTRRKNPIKTTNTKKTH